MADEGLTVAEVGTLADGRTGIVLTGSREAVKAAARLFGCRVAILATDDGPEFEAAVDRGVAVIIRNSSPRVRMDRGNVATTLRTALRAALNQTGEADHESA